MQMRHVEIFEKFHQSSDWGRTAPVFSVTAEFVHVTSVYNFIIAQLILLTGSFFSYGQFY